MGELFLERSEEHHHVPALDLGFTVNLANRCASLGKLLHDFETPGCVSHFAAAELEDNFDSVTLLKEAAGILGLVR